MRASVTACVLAALGALAGGWLIGRWALGCVLIAESGGLVFWALQRDDATGPQVHQLPGRARSVADVLERARRAS